MISTSSKECSMDLSVLQALQLVHDHFEFPFVSNIIHCGCDLELVLFAFLASSTRPTFVSSAPLCLFADVRSVPKWETGEP